MKRREVVLIKLGGSLITDKTRRATPHRKVLERLAREIAQARRDPDAAILLGHGSGSFGHHAAAEAGLSGPVTTESQRRGVSHVQTEAARLHHLVISALAEAGAEPFSLAPSSTAIADGGDPVSVPGETLERVLDLGLLPVIYGDIVPDRSLGAAICSTESLLTAFAATLDARRFQVRRAFWLGETAGILDRRGELIPVVDQDNLNTVRAAIGAPRGTDVTGGMGLRLETCWRLAGCGVTSWILDGRQPGLLTKGLQGDAVRATVVPAHPTVPQGSG